MKYHGFYATLVFASWVGYVLIVYPSHRVISLFEFITDGYAPTKLANKGQQVLAWEMDFNRILLAIIYITIAI